MTSPDSIGVLLAIAALSIAAGFGWTAAAIAWLSMRRLRLGASTRAAVLAQIRLLPLISVIVLGLGAGRLVRPLRTRSHW